MVDPLLKQERTIFVIMPFREANGRNLAQLTSFFEDNLKIPLEQDASFVYRYRVRRSSDQFNITKQIISDLFDADVVVCDLSGKNANPNVMYELGVRLTCSPKPVILIRESQAENESIFDISGFHVFPYDPYIPQAVTSHVKAKLRSFESGEEVFQSPVLEILGNEVPFLRMSRDRAISLLNILEVGLLLSVQAFIGGLNDHLRDEGIDLSIPGPVAEYFKQMQEHESVLQEVDYSGARIIVGPHPALFNFLSTNYLIGLIDNDLEISFSVEMMRYHSRYFLEATWWTRLDPGKCFKFVRHTQVVAALCHSMTDVLRSGGQEQDERSRVKLKSLASLASQF